MFSAAAAVRPPGRAARLCRPADATSSRVGAKRILILGGTGFIGPHFVREALRRRAHHAFNRGKRQTTPTPGVETLLVTATVSSMH
jgi:2'-hydroxyisoflavone reductase